MASRTGWPLLWAGLLASCPVFAASTLSVELGGSAGQASDVNSSYGTLLAGVSGDVELAETVTLHLELDYTRALSQAPPPGLTLGSSGGNVFSFAAGVELAVLDTALLSFDLNVSPSSTVEQQVLASVGPIAFRPLVSSRSQAIGGTLAFGISTGFERDLEASFDLSLAVTRFDSEQQIVDGGGNPITPAQCDRTKYPALCKLLAPQHGTGFVQSRLGGGVTLTLAHDTDVGLSGGYYVYSDDPTQVGFFALATGGRLPATFGDPVPLVPLLWSLRPGVTHRFGAAVSLGVYYEFADGYAAEGTSNLLGLRLAVRLSRAVRLVLRAEGQAFTDAQGNTALSGSVVLATRVEL